MRCFASMCTRDMAEQAVAQFPGVVQTGWWRTRCGGTNFSYFDNYLGVHVSVLVRPYGAFPVSARHRCLTLARRRARPCAALF